MHRKIIILIIVLIIAGIGFTRFLGRDTSSGLALLSEAQIPEVAVATVASLSATTDPLPVLGSVKSESEVTLRTETQGEVIGVYTSLGAVIPQGTIIAEIKNNAEKAAVLQASGVVAAAEAALSKIQTGPREEQLAILELSQANALQVFKEAKNATINTLSTAFSLADDAIRTKVDQFFSNPQSAAPTINFLTSHDWQLEWDRFVIESMFKKWESSLTTLTTEGDLLMALTNADTNLDQIDDFLTAVTNAVNVLSPNVSLSQATIDLWKGAVVAARSNINIAESNISLARDNFNAKSFALSISQKEYEQGIFGEREEDILVAEAALRQAQGALAVANAALERTIIRTPISGTVNSLTVSVGDFVSAFEPVVLIANKGLLEIVTYITEKDIDTIAIGAPARIDSKWNGVVTSIAQALDQKTKKIEVKIALADAENALLSGQSVRADIERTIDGTESLQQFIIPISALKIDIGGAVVFTVDNEHRVVAHPVIEGAIVGEKIIIETGLTPDMEIILDVRGLNAGDEVAVQPLT